MWSGTDGESWVITTKPLFTDILCIAEWMQSCPSWVIGIVEKRLDGWEISTQIRQIPFTSSAFSMVFEMEEWRNIRTGLIRELIESLNRTLSRTNLHTHDDKYECKKQVFFLCLNKAPAGRSVVRDRVFTWPPIAMQISLGPYGHAK